MTLLKSLPFVCHSNYDSSGRFFSIFSPFSFWEWTCRELFWPVHLLWGRSLFSWRTLTPGSRLAPLSHFKLHFSELSVCVLGAYLHQCAGCCVQGLTDGELWMTKCGIICPEKSQANASHCYLATVSTALATPLLFGVRVTFIFMCNKCAGNLSRCRWRGDISEGFILLTDGTAGPPMKRKGTAADALSSRHCAVSDPRVQQSQTSTTCWGLLWIAVLKLLLKRFFILSRFITFP